MNGTDHQMPQPWLGRVVAEANAVQDDYRFVVTSLPEYLADQPTAGLTTWTGELRSGARANVLMGVASNRVDVHQVCAAAERAHRAPRRADERAPAARRRATRSALLDIAWRQLVLNRAHDSSCACSADEVVDAVIVRYQEARQIGDGLARQALHALGRRGRRAAGSTVVVNPTGADRGGLITVHVPGDGPVHLAALDDGTPCPTQVRAHDRRRRASRRSVVGQKVRWVLDACAARSSRAPASPATSSSAPATSSTRACFGVAAGRRRSIDLERPARGAARRSPTRTVTVSTSWCSARADARGDRRGRRRLPASAGARFAAGRRRRARDRR